MASNVFDTFESLLHFGRSHSRTVDWAEIEREISDSDVLNLQFTSGSTGAPKAAALTHHGMINSAQYIGLNMNVQQTDKIAVPVPLFHAFGLIIGKSLGFRYCDWKYIKLTSMQVSAQPWSQARPSSSRLSISIQGLLCGPWKDTAVRDCTV